MTSSKAPSVIQTESWASSAAVSWDDSWKNRYIRKTQSINSLKLLQENEQLKIMLSKIIKNFKNFKEANQQKPKIPNGSSGCSESGLKVKLSNEY